MNAKSYLSVTNPEHLIEKAIRYGGKNQFIGVERMECTDVAAKKFLNSYIELITEKLSEGEGVSIHYFGKLVPHYQTERPGRNLRTGEECKIRARTSVKFKASEILIQKLNPGK